MKNNKNGVSLVAVLLFMLIATIAGTATYKWLSSAGFSSASRMEMNEAKLAASAGIDAARSWMSYNANDVGDAIRQFFEKQQNGEGKFVKLNNVLPKISNNKQKYDVYLVGVDKSRSTYKVKLISVGSSRNEKAKYSEIAILNVTGLYQVKIPGAKTASSATFREALYAGSSGGVSIDVSSGIVNGDITLNTKAVSTDHLIVTGNLSVISDASTHFNDLYVAGGLASCSQLLVNGNAYVGGKIYSIGKSSYKKDLYAGGGIDLTGIAPSYASCNTGATNSFEIGGNLTIEGDLKMPTQMQGNEYSVKGNLVVLNGSLAFATNDESRKDENKLFDVQYDADFMGNIFLENGITGNHISYAVANKVRLGTPGKTVYTGSTKLHQVSNDEGTEIVYPYWLSNTGTTGIYINKDGKFLSEQNAIPPHNGWDDRLDASKWLGEISIPPAKTYCTADNCAPTLGSFGEKPTFWQNPYLYGITQNANGSCSSTYPGNKKCIYDNSWHFDRKTYYHCVCESYDIIRNEAFVQVNGNYTETAPSLTSWLANRMQSYADAMEQAPEKCNSDYYIPPPITFNTDLENSVKVHSKEKPGACAEVGNVYVNEYYTHKSDNLWNEATSKVNWDLLEECYDLAYANGELYENEWLLLHFSGSSSFLANIDWNVPITKKYIIILDEETTVSLPATSSNSMVLIYMKNGGTIGANGDASLSRNYFIYSDGDLDYNNGGVSVDGSIYLANCAKIKSENLVKVQFNETLMNALEGIKALCPTQGGCSAAGSAGSGTSGGTSTNSTFDNYYISTSPQLGIELETQYKNKEIDPNTLGNGTVKPSVIVLPRVVYLPEDADGRLSDYYTVIPLNKMKDSDLSSGSMECPSEIPSTGDLYSGIKLKKGHYTCYYKTGNSEVDGSDGIPLYVEVVDAKGKNPTISLEQLEVEIVNNRAMVRLLAEESDRYISFTVSVPSSSFMPNNWSIIPKNGGLSVDNDGTYEVYNFSNVKPDGNPIDLFEVVTQANAAQGDARFFLDDCEGCVIGIPRQERVFITGSAKVTRVALNEEYCDEEGEKIKNSFGVECSEVSSLLDCNLSVFGRTGGTWIAIHGQNCQPPTSNDEWQCNTGENIYLTPLLWTQNNDYCTPFVSSKKYSPTLGAEYEIPAVFKRNPVKLKIDLVNATDGNVIIEYHRPGVHEENTFVRLQTCSSDCETDVGDLYAGDIVRLTPGKSSDVFNYWLCSGDNCIEPKEDPYNYDSYQFEITKENVIQAHFNKTDDHCTFDDFTETKAFCDGSSTTCIDKCASGTHCSVEDGNNKESEWIMVNANSSCEKFYSLGCHVWDRHKNFDLYESPVINNSEGSITTHSDGTIFSDLLATSVVLNRIKAGHNGVLTSTFVTTAVAKKYENAFKQLLNKTVDDDGFIIRSNNDATEYLSLSIIPGFETTAKLCYISTSSAVCDKKAFTSGLSGSSFIQIITSIPISMTATLADKQVTVDISYVIGGSAFGFASTTFDLSSGALQGHALDDKDHEYIGFKMAAPGNLEDSFKRTFKIYDFSWRTAIEDYMKTCFSAPSVYCSFAANMSGGFVPKDEDISPLVTKSSWLTTKQYSVVYFYNGCDLASDKFDPEAKNILTFFTDRNACVSGKGYYNYDAQRMNSYGVGKLKSSVYNFTSEGKHGVPVTGGYFNDASILLLDQNGNATPYNARCGTFTVGRKESCSRSYVELLADDYADYCVGDDACNPDLSIASPINLRDAKVSFTIDELTSETGDVVVYLQSSGGLSNSAIVVNNSGTYDFNVTGTILDGAGFNPQEVTGLVFVGRNVTTYKVTHIGSVCSNSMTFSCNEPVYDFSKGSWTVSANITNLDPDASCEIIGYDGAYGANSSSEKCATTVSKEISQSGVAGQSEDKKYTFQVVAKVGEDIVGYCDAKKTIVAGSGSQSGSSSSETELSMIGCPESVSNITNYGFSFSPTVYGCDGGCTLQINRGTIYPSGSYKGGEIKVSEITSTGDVKIMLSDGSKTTDCYINVESLKSAITVECPTGSYTDKKINDVVSIIPHAVDGCNSDCEYAIKRGGNTVTSGAGYNGGAISLQDPNATAGENAYTLTVSKGHESGSCEFTVSYTAMMSSSSTAISSSATTLTEISGNSGLADYKPGQTYHLKTGDLSGGPTTFHCKVASLSSVERIVGTFVGNQTTCTIKIPAYNDASYGNSCSGLSSNTEYTFTVESGAPDVSCGIYW